MPRLIDEENVYRGLDDGYYDSCCWLSEEGVDGAARLSLYRLAEEIENLPSRFAGQLSEDYTWLKEEGFL